MPLVLGPVVDEETRCIHHHLPLDVIAIKFRCCGQYYPCYKCHEQCENHTRKTWSRLELETEKVVLCGCCKSELTFAEYTSAGNDCCFCGAHFNPGCSRHYSLYFDVSSECLRVKPEGISLVG